MTIEPRTNGCQVWPLRVERLPRPLDGRRTTDRLTTATVRVRDCGDYVAALQIEILLFPVCGRGPHGSHAEADPLVVGWGNSKQLCFFFRHRNITCEYMHRRGRCITNTFFRRAGRGEGVFTPRSAARFRRIKRVSTRRGTSGASGLNALGSRPCVEKSLLRRYEFQQLTGRLGASAKVTFLYRFSKRRPLLNKDATAC